LGIPEPFGQLAFHVTPLRKGRRKHTCHSIFTVACRTGTASSIVND
jgi:hypothetical protein